MTIPPYGEAATTLIGRRDWLDFQGLRLDAAAYSSGGLQVRDQLLSGPWICSRLDGVSKTVLEARFARTYVQDPAHGVPYLTASDMLLADLKGLLYLSRRRAPQMERLRIQEGWTLVSRSGTIG